MLNSHHVNVNLTSTDPEPSRLQYTRLEDGQIRLLHLDGTALITVPGSRAQDLAVVCRLQTVSRPEGGRDYLSYTALSYVWGSAAFGRWILCNDQLVKVTGNLYNFLLQLTLEWTSGQHDGQPESMAPGSAGPNPSRPCPVWVDALCINQADLVEKSVQVQLLAQVYRSASYVTVWLGSGAEASGEDLARFWQDLSTSDLESASSSDQGVLQEESASGHAGQLDSREASEAAFAPSIAGIKYIESCNWFRRAWTMQEIVLARRAFIRCGPFVVDWQVLQDLYGDLSTIKAVTMLQQSLQRVSQQREAHSAHVNPFETPTPLARLLDAAIGRQASDPRDRVFSLLPLCSLLKPSDSRVRYPVADYEASVEKVFRTTTLAVMTEAQGLGFLDLIKLPVIELSKSSMLMGPSQSILQQSLGCSWVPEWDDIELIKRGDDQPSRRFGSSQPTVRSVLGFKPWRGLEQEHPETGFNVRIEDDLLVCPGALVGRLSYSSVVRSPMDGTSLQATVEPLPACLYDLTYDREFTDNQLATKRPSLRFHRSIEIWRRLGSHDSEECTCSPSYDEHRSDRSMLRALGLWTSEVTKSKMGWVCTLSHASSSFVLSPGLCSCEDEVLFTLVANVGNEAIDPDMPFIATTLKLT